MAEILCTRKDYEKAREYILMYFQRNGVVPRRTLTSFKAFGLNYEAIELAVRKLTHDGILEELYTLPKSVTRPGQRKEWLGLTTALNSGAAELPQGVIRQQDAFELIADLEVVA